MKKNPIKQKLFLNKKVISLLQEQEKISGGWHTSACRTEVSCISACLCPITEGACPTRFSANGCCHVVTINGCITTP